MKILILANGDDDNKVKWRGGIIGEIFDFLNLYTDTTVCYVEPIQNKIKRIFAQYTGCYRSKKNIEYDKFDKIVVFPIHYVGIIPKKYRYKVIAIGPDSPSMNAASLLKNVHNNIINKFIRMLFFKASKASEWYFIKNINKLLVVGRSDRRFTKFYNNFLSEKDRAKIKYLHHPILSEVVKKELEYNSIEIHNREFVISGDLPKKYQENFIKKMAFYLEKELSSYNVCLRIVVVGKNNEWIYNCLRKIEYCNTQYIPWIDDYNEVCHIGVDIHCFPMLFGSGTKNRTLTALANGLEIISTFKGVENINFNKLTSVKVTNSPKKFVSFMIDMSKMEFNKEKASRIIAERVKFKKDTNKFFYMDLKENILE